MKLLSIPAKISPWKISPWIVVILLVGLCTYSVAIGWGLPTDSSWAADAIHPLDVIEKTKAYPYPPLQFYILRLVYAPFTLAANLGWIDLASTLGITTLMVVGRATSVLMALGIIVSIYLTSLEVSQKQLPALLSAAFVLGNAPLVYYAKVMNVDVPYIFWFSLALIFYIRAIKFDRLMDYSLFALVSMLSICTKDQAYGLVAMPTVFLACRCWYRSRNSRFVRRFIRLLMPTVVGLSTFLIVHNIFFDFSTFSDHFDFLGKSSYTPTNFTHAPSVYLQRYRYLIVRVCQDITLNLGWPITILALIAVVTALVRKNRQRLLLYLLLPCFSYYVLLLSFIMYSRDRFVIPICLILCIFCGHFLGDLLDKVQRIYPLKMVVVTTLAGLLTYSFFYANSVNALMMQDSRYVVEQWMIDHIQPPATVGFVEKLRNHPRFRAPQVKQISIGGVSSLDLQGAVERQDFSYLITSSGYGANRFPEASEQYQGFATLSNGRYYRLVFCHRSTPLWNFIRIEEPTPAEYYEPRRKTGNLNKINPEICLYEKR